MPAPIEVRKVPLHNVSDASELAKLIDDGVLEADRVVAVIGKTEGNGGVNDYTRIIADRAFREVLVAKGSRGEDEVRLTKRCYGWPEDKKFYVPDGVYDHFRQGIGKRGKSLRDAWFERVAEYRTQYPELAEELSLMQHRRLPEGWDHDLPEFPADAKGLATRESSAQVLNAAARNIPWLLGGSADLAPSTKTRSASPRNSTRTSSSTGPVF